MSKHRLELEEERRSSPKRQRLVGDKADRLSALSDELILGIFSHLSVTELNTCQR
jgi:hypothetical protein